MLLPKVEISYRLPLEFRKKLRNKGFPDFLISCSYGISHFFNIQGTYKSPSWVNQEMCRCIDEFMLSCLEYGIKKL